MLPRVILILLGLVAQALGLPADQADPSAWGSLALASGVVWGVVEYLKTYALKNLDGIRVHVLAGAVGILLGVSLGLGEVITGLWVDWVLFGVQAAFYATIVDVAGKTAVKSIAKARAA
mgnify:CR=1 FL=1